jgi:sortase A
MDHSPQNNLPKGYPRSTPQVAEMLGISNEESIRPDEVGHDDSPLNLPVVDAEAAHITPTTSAVHAETSPANSHDSHADSSAHASASHEEELSPFDVQKRSTLKTVLPYIAIFVVGIFLYYFYFSTFSFTSITNIFKKVKTNTSQTVSVTEKTTALEGLKKAQLKNYYTYMGQFYFDTSDVSVLDPDADNSHNGLTNFQKYLLNLNPKVYDSLGLGMADSQTLAAGIDPGTGDKLAGTRKELVDKYFDLEVANNRLSLGSLQNPNAESDSQALTQTGIPTYGQVAGASIGARNAGATAAGSIGYSPSIAYAPTTSVSNSRTAPATGQAPKLNSSSVSSTPAVSSPTGIPGQDFIGISTEKPAILEIPSQKITVPIIWTSDTKFFESDLKNGVVHYPGTPFPGEIGTSYISGHSSNYAWVKGNYNKVFDHLDQLQVGTSFTITVTVAGGKQAKLHYVVTKQQEFKPNDPAQFVNTAKSQVALSTCWPIGTTARRLVVYGELTQVEN